MVSYALVGGALIALAMTLLAVHKIRPTYFRFRATILKIFTMTLEVETSERSGAGAADSCSGEILVAEVVADKARIATDDQRPKLSG